jgi:hypothetical protein
MLNSIKSLKNFQFSISCLSPDLFPPHFLGIWLRKATRDQDIHQVALKPDRTSTGR